MHRQASSNISSHSWGLSIRTVTLKLIRRLPPPPPAGTGRSAEPRGLAPPAPPRAAAGRRHRGEPAATAPPPPPPTGVRVDRLAFLVEQRAAVFGEPQVGDPAAEAAAEARAAGRRPLPPAGLGCAVAIRVIRLPLSWIV